MQKCTNRFICIAEPLSYSLYVYYGTVLLNYRILTSTVAYKYVTTVHVQKTKEAEIVNKQCA